MIAMSDVRVSDNGSFAVIELLTDRAKDWYADNVKGAPAVSGMALTIDSGPASGLIRKVAKADLTIERITQGYDDATASLGKHEDTRQLPPKHVLHSTRWPSLSLLASAALLACASPTGTGPGERFEETHHTIVEGTVLGAVNQPLEGVHVIVHFTDGSSLPATATTTTDPAGEYLFVLAIYNGPRNVADSARATVYAFARGSRYSDPGADHADVMLHFAPVSQNPPRQRINLQLPIY